MREARRLKWENERKEREKADQEYRQKREEERLDRTLQRKANEDNERYSSPPLLRYPHTITLFSSFKSFSLVHHSLNSNDSRAQRKWQAHTNTRAKIRERQAQRLEEERKEADRQFEELRRRREEIAARQLIRQDKLLKEEAKRSEEAPSSHSLAFLS